MPNASQPNAEPQVIAYPLHGNCYLNITSSCTLRCTFCPKHNRTWEVQSFVRSRRSTRAARSAARPNGPADYHPPARFRYRETEQANEAST